MTRLTPNMAGLLLLMRERGGVLGAGELANAHGAARALELRGLIERGAIRTETRGLVGAWRLTPAGERAAAGEADRRALGAEMAAAHAALFQPPGRPWGPGARACPACGCAPGRPCEIMLQDGAGTGWCVPAGVHGLAECSACAIEYMHATTSSGGYYACGTSDAMVWRGPGVTPARECPACFPGARP